MVNHLTSLKSINSKHLKKHYFQTFGRNILLQINTDIDKKCSVLTKLVLTGNQIFIIRKWPCIHLEDA